MVSLRSDQNPVLLGASEAMVVVGVDGFGVLVGVWSSERAIGPLTVFESKPGRIEGTYDLNMEKTEVEEVGVEMDGDEEEEEE